MEKFEELNKKIQETQELIKEKTTLLSSLKEELVELEKKSWSPPNGDYVVDSTGNILDLSNDPNKLTWVNPEFGNVRSSKKKAEKLTKNQKNFNRISAYFDDVAPVIEVKINEGYSTISLNFYDYSKILFYI